MNNLKKVLALSLAATSILGTLASANFTDKDTIVASDAVDTLVALDIIKGYDDGSFKPEATVTRAEMAKMIFTIKNGGSDDASAFASVPTSFNDVKGHWAEGYIKYAYSQGIIAGRNATTFDPNGKITGTEALKMTLATLGFKADKSGLVGSTWVANTVALAGENGLTVDYIGGIGESAQRQSAAQILYNALYAETVRYSPILADYEVTNTTLGKSTLDLATQEGVVIEKSTKEGGLITSGTNSTNLPKTDKDFTKYIGQKVDVLWSSKTKKAYGVKVNSGVKVITGFVSDVALSTSSGKDYAEKDGVKIELVAGQKAEIQGLKPNTTITIIDNNDKALPVTLKAVAAIVGKVSFVNSTRINITDITGSTDINSLSTLEFEGNTIPSDIKVDDVIIATKDLYNDNKKITKLDKKTGTIEATRTGEVKIGGTWYTFDVSTSYNAGDEISYYTVGNVIYFSEVTAASESSYAYVVATEKADGLTDTNKAKLLFADGTTKVVETKYDYTTNTDNDNYKADGKLVSYSISKDVYTLTLPTTSGTNKDFDDEDLNKTTTDFIKGNKYFDAFKRYYIADDATILISYGNTVAANGPTKFASITGAQLKAWKDTKVEDLNIYVSKASNGVEYIKLASLSLGTATRLPSETSTTKYGYVLDNTYTIKENDETYIVSTVFNGTETVTLKAVKGDITEKDGKLVKNSYVSYELSADGKYAADITVLETDAEVVNGFDSKTGVVVIEGATKDYQLTNSTVIVGVDSTNVKGVVGASIAKATNTDGDIENIPDANVRLVLDDTDILAVFVDAGGMQNDAAEDEAALTAAKQDLQGAIDTAEAKVTGVIEAANDTALSSGDKWATAEDLKAINGAIATAKAAKAATAATVTSLKAAKEALVTATNAFKVNIKA